MVQETIFKGFERFGTFEGTTPEELAHWLRQILLNQLADTLDFFTREKRNVGREQKIQNQHVQSRQPSPHQEARRREKRELVDAAMARLPEHYRRVILLRHYEGLSFGEIAAIIGNSEDGAQKLWVRAVDALQEHLQADSSWTGESN